MFCPSLVYILLESFVCEADATHTLCGNGTLAFGTTTALPAGLRAVSIIKNMEIEPVTLSALVGGWELESRDGQKTNTQMLYLNAVGASDNMVRTALLRPLVGLIIDSANSSLCIRRIGGTVPGFPPERLRLDGGFAVAYNETGRQWVRLLHHNPSKGELELERVGPKDTFPRIHEIYKVEKPPHGPEALVKTMRVVSFLGLEIYRGKQRFTRMSRPQLYNQRQALEAPMEPEVVEGIYRELGGDVLILAVENAQSSGSFCKMVSSCGATHQEYLIGVAGMQDRSPYIVRRRYREFRALYELTKDFEGDHFPEFPRKTYLVSPYGDVLRDRRRKLQHFLSHLIELPNPHESGLWHAQRDFLLVGQKIESELEQEAMPEALSVNPSSSFLEKVSSSDASDPLTRNLNYMRAQSVRRRHREDPRNALLPSTSSRSASTDSGPLSLGVGTLNPASTGSIDGGIGETKGPDLGKDKSTTMSGLSAHQEAEGEDDDEDEDAEGEGPSASAVPPSLTRSREGVLLDYENAARLVSVPRSTSPLSSVGEPLSAATSVAADYSTAASQGEDSDEAAVKSLTDWLAAGVLVTKISSKEKAYPRVLYYNAPRDVLFWTKCGEKGRIQKGKTISIRDIRNVDFFQARAEDSGLGQAPIQGVKITTTRRDYDFELSTTEDAQKIARGLKILMSDC